MELPIIVGIDPTIKKRIANVTWWGAKDRCLTHYHCENARSTLSCVFYSFGGVGDVDAG